MKIAPFCIAILFVANSICTNAMQQQYTITDLPQNVIRHITGLLAVVHLTEDDDAHALDLAMKKNLAAFANTCRYLQASVAQEDKEIAVACSRNQKSVNANLPVSVFLDQVFLCLRHIVARNGNNPISLSIHASRLSDDMDAVSSFFAECSQKQIAQYITHLYLPNNELRSLPKGLQELTALKRLWISCNYLQRKDLVELEKIINESLHKMEEVDVSLNSISLRDVYQTIAQCKLKELRTLSSHPRTLLQENKPNEEITIYTLEPAYWKYYLKTSQEEPTPEEKAACKVENMVLV